jgi:hypothetical protein
MNQHWTPGAIVALVEVAIARGWGHAEIVEAQAAIARFTLARAEARPVLLAMVKSAGVLLVATDHVHAVYP